MTEPYYAIKGIQDGLGDAKNPLRQVPLRMELDDWCNSTDDVHKNQRALFFQAFHNFCQMDPTAKLSYFQIAGIHGQPFVRWDEDEKAKVENQGKSGYCTHNSILFTTWHRPYMLLFEQVLYGLMKDVAGTFSESERPAMLEALESWRFPYWDWATKKPDPNNRDPADYNVPVVLPYRGVEIKVPAAFKEQSQPPSFPIGDVWQDPSPPVPGEHRQPVTNPFYQFTMPDGYANMGDPKLGTSAIKADTWRDRNTGVEYNFPLNECKATTRHAEVKPGVDPRKLWIAGNQNNDAIVNGLRSTNPFNRLNNVPGNLRASLADGFYRVVRIPKFEDFGTKRVQGMGPGGRNTKQIVYDSAESLHDFLHGVCGGNEAEFQEATGKTLFLLGHMSDVPVAAFDPIFWIHHCNVDRMTAIWEVLHAGDPDSWFDGTDARDKDSGNWAIKVGHPDVPSDPLRPFHKSEAGDYWTSNDVRETAKYGYAYPELEKWKHVDAEGKYDAVAHKQALAQYLNTRYNTSARAAIKAKLTADPGEPQESSKPNLLQLMMKMPDPTPDEDIIGFNDYVVNIVYNRFALGGRPYTIHIFVGRVPDQLPYTFDDPEGSLVGQVFTFSSPADRQGTSELGCVNCRTQEAAEIESSGTVVLTNALITRWKNQLVHTPRQRLEGEPELPRVLASMEPEDVVPFLKTNLRWRVTSLEGLVPVEQLQSLKVSVAVGKADHFADPTKLSRFYDYKGANEVTKDRPQGAGPDDGLYPPGWDYDTQA